MKLRNAYFEFPVWLFYWIDNYSRYSGNLKEYRKTIVKDPVIAARHGRSMSPEPLIKIAGMIDKYKKW